VLAWVRYASVGISCRRRRRRRRYRRRRRVCVCVCVCMCVSVTRRYCIETAARIELIFCVQVSLDLCYTVF